MTDAIAIAETRNLIQPREANSVLVKQLFALAGPVWIEQILHMLVGLNDTYLANHLPSHAADAGAAVGTITYFLWFIGLLVASIGAGSTALIARAKGAHAPVAQQQSDGPIGLGRHDSRCGCRIDPVPRRPTDCRSHSASGHGQGICAAISADAQLRVAVLHGDVHRRMHAAAVVATRSRPPSSWSSWTS